MKPSLVRTLRTFFTSKLTARWFAHLAVVELLILCVVILPSLSAHASFTGSNGDFTIWAEAGRATHGFAIEDGQNSPNNFPSGVLTAPGGTKISGNYPNAGNGMQIRDLTTNETAPLPDDGNGAVTIPPGAWSNGSGTLQSVYFVVDGWHSSNQLAVLHPNGTMYLATVDSSSWVPGFMTDNGWSESGVVTGVALIDPAQSFRIIDLTTNEQFTQNETFTAWTGWEPIPAPPPVHVVWIALSEEEAGNYFTVHSQQASGAEMLESVLPSRMSGWGNYLKYDGSGEMTDSAPIAIQATVGEGMAFWVTRNVDGYNSLSQTTSPNSGQYFLLTPEVVNSGNNLLWSLKGVFPPVGTQPMTFHVEASLVNGYTWDGNQPISGSPMGILQGSSLTPLTPVDLSTVLTIPDLDLSGNPHDFNYYEFTANVNPNEPYWIVDYYSTIFTTNPYEHWAWNGWSPMNGTPPPQGGTDTIKWIIPTGRSQDTFHLYRGNPSGDGIAKAQWYSCTLYPATLTNAWTGDTREVNEGAWEQSFSYEGTDPQGWYLMDANTGEVREIHAGENDLRDWHYGTTGQNVQISLTRWSHDLRIRCEDGSEFPVSKSFSQGDLSSALGQAWYNPYYYFDGQSNTIPALNWFVWDETMQEAAPMNSANLINWIVLPAITITSVSEYGPGPFLNSFRVMVAPVISQTSRFELHRSIGNGPWEIVSLTGTMMMNAGTSVEMPISYPLRSSTVRFRARSYFGGHYSQYSAEASIEFSTPDSDGDGIPDRWESIWGLDPMSSNDAGLRVMGQGETALALFHANPDAGPDAYRPSDGGLPSWKIPRLDLWQTPQYDWDTYPDNAPGETHNVLSWDFSEGIATVSGSITLEVEKEDGSWIPASGLEIESSEGVWTSVASVPVATRYARVRAPSRAGDDYARKLTKRVVPANNELFNYRVVGTATSNESQVKVRLRTQISRVDRKNPVFVQFLPPWWDSSVVVNNEDIKLYKKFVEVTRYTDEYTDDTDTTTVSINTDTGMKTEVVDRKHGTALQGQGLTSIHTKTLLVLPPPLSNPSHRLQSFEWEESYQTTDYWFDDSWSYTSGLNWSRDAIAHVEYNHSTYIPYDGDLVTVASSTTSSSQTERNTGSPVKVWTQYKTQTEAGGSIYQTYPNKVPTNTPVDGIFPSTYTLPENSYYMPYIDIYLGPTSFEEGWTYGSATSKTTYTLSENYPLLQYQADTILMFPVAYATVPTTWEDIHEDSWSSTSRIITRENQTFPSLIEGSATHWPALISKLLFEYTNGDLTVCKGNYWLECNDCLPSAPFTVAEWSEKTFPDGKVGKTFVRALTINPGSDPYHPTKTEIVQSDVTEIPSYDPPELDHPLYPNEIRTLELAPRMLAMDYNRDGSVEFSDDDAAPLGAPYLFWLNNDHDIFHTVDADAIPVHAGDELEEYDDVHTFNQLSVDDFDRKDDKILNERDLEDFTRLHLDLKGYVDVAKRGKVVIAIDGMPSSIPSTPKIRMFRAPFGGTLQYLTDQVKAHEQTTGLYAEALPVGITITVPASRIAQLDEYSSKLWYIFEGVEPGLGRASVTIYDENNVKVVESQATFIKIVDVRNLFDRHSCGTLQERWDIPNITPPNGFEFGMPKLVAESTAALERTATRGDVHEYLLLVHGYNMSPADKQEFAATAFKRLWHAGYRGRFGFFEWPTYFFSGYSGRVTALNGAPPIDLFNESEKRAWLSAPALRGLLDKLDATYPKNVSLAAHSLGNAAAGEALRMNGPKLRNFFATQAAISAHLFDPAATPIVWRTLNQFKGNLPATSLGPDTPNIFATYAPPVLPATWATLGVGPYFAPMSVQGGSMAYHNYFNPLDYALNWPVWEFNTQAKPHLPLGGFGGQRYAYMRPTTPNLVPLLGPGDFFWKADGSFEGMDPLDFPADRFEIFASAAESHSICLGRGPVTELSTNPLVQKWNNRNLSTTYASGGPGYGKAHKYHSGQFRGPIWERRKFWEQLVSDMHDQSLIPPQ